jgi:hypothetical protein
MSARADYLQVLYPLGSRAGLKPITDEHLREEAINLGLCQDCLAKFPDPIRELPAQEGEAEELPKFLAGLRRQIDEWEERSRSAETTEDGRAWISEEKLPELHSAYRDLAVRLDAITR